MSSIKSIETNPKQPKTSMIDGQDLKILVEASLTWLRTNQQLVNSLNVFPVPDGDTGTNMLLTMQAAYAEIANSSERNLGKVAHAIAQGALMGARGNSGVILSQILRGFARGLDSLDTADIQTLVSALAESQATAYKGVVRPVEGTILTVIKDIAIAAQSSAQKADNLPDFLEILVAAADISVRHTPELLPILKQAGVVDSGGKGLFILLEGMLRHVQGLGLDTAVAAVQPLSAMNLEQTMEAVEPGQEVEVVIDFRPKLMLDLDNFYNELSKIGTSIQIGEGDGMYRMHIHVSRERQEEPLAYVKTLGTWTKVAMENLEAQMESIEGGDADDAIALQPVEPGQIAVIAVSPGKGISRIFASLGVNGIVEGGQTMNPSTEEILASFEHLPTDKVIILPNNKNIVLAAQTASTVTSKQVSVIPSVSIPQGLSALLHLNPEGEFDRLVADMKSAVGDVETGEITIATRSVELNGIQVQQGSVIALLNGKIVYSSSDIKDALLHLLEEAQTADHERITLFYGADMTIDQVNALVEDVEAIYPSHEIEIHEGGQPYYHFIISIG
ncbi:MAG: DAK2 domain protein [Bacteroidetes bacterium ADurb.Bin416]|nr:MAG: DAK2 domain protein [Bacteroidetes bacterium ADurb.Bin416]